MRESYTNQQLSSVANNIRIGITEGIYAAGSGHPGGSYSIAELLATLYFKEMNVDPQNPQWAERDRFVLSKGHAAPAYYATLAERGFFPVEDLKTLRKIDSYLQGHPDRKKVAGVDMSTGSLGQGISAAVGMALYAKRTGASFRVYCIIGDGEMQEGQVWEAMMAAAHYKLDNLVVMLDNNNLQIDGNVDEVMSIYPIMDKVTAFGWSGIAVDGHDVQAISDAFQQARNTQGKPTMLVCKTTKGKGISYMENQVAWHGSGINAEQYAIALEDLKSSQA